MIDARELRIGNWVRDEWRDENIKATAQTIEEVDKGYGKFYHPISLTPNALDQFGFKVDSYSANLYHCPIGYWQVYIDDSTAIFRTPGASLANVKHLHQLQNLYYALTGTELNYQP